MSRRLANDWSFKGTVAQKLVTETNDNPEATSNDEFPYLKKYRTPAWSSDGGSIGDAFDELENNVANEGGNADSEFDAGMGELTTETDSIPNQTDQKAIAGASNFDTIKREAMPLTRLASSVLKQIQVWSETEEDFVEADSFDRIMAYPELDFPLYKFLERISKDSVIPNVHEVYQNSVTLFETNARFLEALFVGANQEMGRELLWRKYPTDQRGSYFRMFWDKSDSELEDDFDVSELHTWADANPLGEQQAMEDQLVLVVRAELLDKFPNTLIYAQAATQEGTDIVKDTTAAPVYPVFKARVNPDIVLIGFNLTAAQAKGTTGPDDHGYFFTFQERPGELRFGLDVETDSQGQGIVITSWNQLGWDVFQNLIIKTTIPIDTAFDNEDADANVILGRSSSDLAFITNQLPISYSIHAGNLI